MSHSDAVHIGFSRQENVEGSKYGRYKVAPPNQPTKGNLHISTVPLNHYYFPDGYSISVSPVKQQIWFYPNDTQSSTNRVFDKGHYEHEFRVREGNSLRGFTIDGRGDITLGVLPAGLIIARDDGVYPFAVPTELEIESVSNHMKNFAELWYYFEGRAFDMTSGNKDHIRLVHRTAEQRIGVGRGGQFENRGRKFLHNHHLVNETNLVEFAGFNNDLSFTLAEDIDREANDIIHHIHSRMHGWSSRIAQQATPELASLEFNKAVADIYSKLPSESFMNMVAAGRVANTIIDDDFPFVPKQDISERYINRVVKELASMGEASAESMTDYGITDIHKNPIPIV